MNRFSATGAPSIDCLQGLVQYHSITASLCISKLAQSGRRSASPNLLDHGLQVHLQSRSIMASKCISRLALLWLASLHDQCLQSGSPNSLDYGLQVRTIMVCRCTCPNSLDHSLQVHLQTLSITASSCIFKLSRLWSASSHDHGLESASPNSLDYGLHVCTIMATKCISKLARSLSRSASLSTPDHGLQVIL